MAVAVRAGTALPRSRRPADHCCCNRPRPRLAARPGTNCGGAQPRTNTLAQVMTELTSAALALDRDPSVRVMVITGDGPKSFVAGGWVGGVRANCVGASGLAVLHASTAPLQFKPYAPCHAWEGRAKWLHVCAAAVCDKMSGWLALHTSRGGHQGDGGAVVRAGGRAAAQPPHVYIFKTRQVPRRQANFAVCTSQTVLAAWACHKG